MEREGNVSGCSCNYKTRTGTTNLPTGGGAGERHVRSQLRPQKQGREDDIQAGGGEEGRDVRLQLPLQNECRDNVQSDGEDFNV